MKVLHFFRTHPLAKRLPFLVFALVGVWLWRNTGTLDHTLVWQLDGSGWAAIRKVEIQVQDGDGALAKREERYYPQGPPPEIRQELKLEPGTYDALVLVTDETQTPPVPLRTKVEIGRDPLATVRLRYPPLR